MTMLPLAFGDRVLHRYNSRDPFTNERKHTTSCRSPQEVAQKSKQLSRIIIVWYYNPVAEAGFFSPILSIEWAQDCYKCVLNILRVT